MNALIPQRFTQSAAELAQWQAAYPSLSWFAQALHLDHVLTSLWFAIVLFLFLAAILVSTFSQARLSWNKTFVYGNRKSSVQTPIHRTPPEVFTEAKRLGYRKIRCLPNTYRLIKYPLGLWGKTFFHLGVTVILIAAMFMFLSQRRGVVNLTEGEIFSPGMAWFSEEKGPLAEVFFLPQALRLDSVQQEFWDTDDIKQQRSTVTFLGPGQTNMTYSLEINKTVYHQGVRIDQSSSFGHAFLLILTDRKGETFPLRLEIELPPKRDQASYETFEFTGIPYVIQAKYYADAEKGTMISNNPLLTIRLVQNNSVVGMVSLTPGQRGQLGPYSTNLVAATKWTGLLFSDVSGMGVLFFGFFITILGSGLAYFQLTREIILQKVGNQWCFSWEPGKFAEFYQSEIKVLTEDEKSNI